MARSFLNAKLFSTFVIDGISNAISRRGYAAASQGTVSSGIRGGTGRSAAAAVKEEMAGGTKEKVSWVPDPVTGCYRPENSAKEIDVAELRAMLLKKN
ncbi:Indole-3-acetic acid-induced protein ARG2 [Hibiscus syriacus]|uniref:Indole-3-acetic acid-induced protein ARG2 n=1 Tax=Hibiscus syriacus TaxID=106335 RepID=A0A6A2YE32_HIBSY|nr:protein SENESCENCE-ASSOCIATED GENE 21, mitochondrial-like isoform X1 [Hibiscus syriacus]XP_039035779.1 protein SENESCENCE-ASSOCIATED GENE 21, mitochondrial-like isoform X1 [Hibiscus syriacus]XP_039035781.1 protein SENESCENCE-ASSOCIATED GENE 21, mitochondrial-like isoform X1 [Hibiscus syriacus]XP_039035782.1 protein SENESCENCE-ASSOCIATED GENE 21, mitochondrial-like isoform X2 [Hibiscus syriacus]KAE8672237.1 Indole-3-acetic acid-induced protein ARG2 [Hibiscus syriacus]